MKSARKLISIYLIAAILVIGMVSAASAGLSPSELVELQKVDRAQDLQKVQQVLEMKVVKNRFEQLGFTQDQINSKLSNLSDQQLHQLANKLDNIKVGGDGLEVVVALLIIVILIIVILQLTGHRVLVK